MGNNESKVKTKRGYAQALSSKGGYEDWREFIL